MATNTRTKGKIEILGSEDRPVSYDREEMRKVIRELAEARRRRKRKSTAHDAK